jgi:Putative rhamnosyl transferase
LVAASNGGAGVFDHRPIFGHVRFSFYGFTDTRMQPTADGASLARLYDEARMARRFFLFENLTLKSLIAQTDKNFTTVILTSDVMPDRFKERLSAVAARLPGAVVEYSAQRRGDLALRKHMVDAAAPKLQGTSVHFRLDDDDGLAAGYVERLRKLTQGLSPSTHLTFPSGIMLFPAGADTQQGVSMLHQRFLTAIGLATVNGPGFNKNPFQMMHSNVWTRWPLVSDPTFPAFIRTQHYDNDTAAKQDRIISGLQRERGSRRAARHAAAVDAALATHFPFIDRDALDGLIGRCGAIRSMDDLDPLT